MKQTAEERIARSEEMLKDNKRKHVCWDYYNVGAGASLDGDDANEIIEEIVSFLCKQGITVYVAKQLLEDAISSIDKNAALDKML